MMMALKSSFIAPVAFTLAACQLEEPEIFEAAPGLSEVEFAKATLNSLQVMSFENNREFCGYIVRTPDGTLAATTANQGRISSCRADSPSDDHLIVASYHTHGAFENYTPAEFPSMGDVLADEDEGIDGYVSTPGGRLWYVDGAELIVSQICGVGCLTKDPNFEAGLDGDIKVSYSIDELRASEED
jgi:hypothetical protein